MSNRQCYPSSLFPLQGDIAAAAGATSVTVVGLQTVPISTDTPSDLNVLTFFASTGEWTPAAFDFYCIPANQVLEWSCGSYPAAISYLGLGTLGIGSGALGDVSGGLALTAILLYDGTHFTTIEGNATSNWVFKFPVNAGTSGYVLQTDGHGNTSWVAQSGGGGSTLWSALTGSLTVSQVVPWNSGFGIDTGISRISQGGLAIGNGTPGDISGTLSLFELIVNGGINFLNGSQILDNTGSPGNTNQFLSSGNGTGEVIWANAVTSVSFTGGLISVANPTTTPALTVAGTSGGIPYFSSSSTWASSAVLPSGDFVLGGGAGSAPTASFSVVPVAKGGTATGSTLTGVVRGGNPFTASEISGDATTSGSNALTLATVNSSPGTFTYATLTVNGKGLVTAASSGAAPTGTVTSFSAGNLSPLFTTSVANPTTTPALSFSLNTQVANTAFMGPVSGGPAAPTFRLLVATDIPAAGLNGDIQYNNHGALGGSASTITAAGSFSIPSSQIVEWSAGLYPAAISYLGLGTLAIGAGTAGDVSGGIGLSAILLYDGTHFTTIEGNATTNWTFKFPVNAGTSGQVLQTDGAGNTSWGSLSSGVAWSALTNSVSNLTLVNGANTTTFDQTTGALWTWANTTPSVTGAVGSVVLSLSTAPVNAGGNNWVYTLSGSASGAGSNGWAGASVTIAGYTGGAAGNNGTSLPITASTTTTVTITNPTGTTSNTGTPTMISTAVVPSPAIVLAGTINAGTAGSLVSTTDSWTIQVGTMKTITNNPAPTVPNPVSVLQFSHVGSSGTAYVQIPNLQGLPSSDIHVDLMENGGNIFFTTEGGTNQGGSISLGAGPGSFGIKGQISGKTTFVEGNVMATTVPCIAFSSTAACTLTSGTGICVAFGSGGGAGNPGTDTFTFNPASGTAAFQCVLINPIIEGTSSGATTALLVNPTYTLTNLTGTNLLLDLQNSGTSEFNVNTSGVVGKVAGLTTTKNGIAATLATSLLTAQTAAISAHALVSSASAYPKGMWRISFVATATTASTGGALGGTTGFQITFTNGNGDAVAKTTSQTAIVSVGTSTADTVSGNFYAYAGSSSNITYSFGYTAGTGPLAYDIAVYAEFLG